MHLHIQLLIKHYTCINCMVVLEDLLSAEVTADRAGNRSLFRMGRSTILFADQRQALEVPCQFFVVFTGRSASASWHTLRYASVGLTGARGLEIWGTVDGGSVGDGFPLIGNGGADGL